MGRILWSNPDIIVSDIDFADWKARKPQLVGLDADEIRKRSRVAECSLKSAAELREFIMMKLLEREARYGRPY